MTHSSNSGVMTQLIHHLLSSYILTRVEHGSHRGWGEPHRNLHRKHRTCTAVKAAGAGFTCRLCICTAVWLRCCNTTVYRRNYRCKPAHRQTLGHKPLTPSIDMYDSPDTSSAYSLSGHIATHLPFPCSVSPRVATACPPHIPPLTFEGQTATRPSASSPPHRSPSTSPSRRTKTRPNGPNRRKSMPKCSGPFKVKASPCASTW